MQLRAAIGLQGFAGIQFGQHLKAGGQVQRVGIRHADTQLTQQGTRLQGTIAAQGTEALEGDLGMAAAAVEEGAEGVFGHAVGPVWPGDEAGVAGQGQQATAVVAALVRQRAGQHATQRPATQPDIARQLAVEVVDPGLDIAVGQFRQGHQLHLQAGILGTQAGCQRLQ
ncbi:hypothetical protein D3C80_1162440 [compost metagenome]